MESWVLIVISWSEPKYATMVGGFVIRVLKMFKPSTSIGISVDITSESCLVDVQSWSLRKKLGVSQFFSKSLDQLRIETYGPKGRFGDPQFPPIKLVLFPGNLTIFCSGHHHVFLFLFFMGTLWQSQIVIENGHLQWIYP